MSGVDDKGRLDPRYCCVRCEEALAEHLSRLVKMVSRRFIVCTTCGNKRCPRATDHELECTGSNEPGQPGSRYQ